jgi:hypothetical protein
MGTGSAGRFQQPAARTVEGAVEKDTGGVETRFEAVERWETHRGRCSMVAAVQIEGNSDGTSEQWSPAVADRSGRCIVLGRPHCCVRWNRAASAHELVGARWQVASLGGGCTTRGGDRRSKSVATAMASSAAPGGGV